MFRRRSGLPPELRDALRAADRAARAVPRRGRWRRRLAMLLPGALVPSLGVILGWLVLQDRFREAPAPHRIEMPRPTPDVPPANPARAALPRVIYGGGTEAPSRGSAAFAVRAVVVDGDTIAHGGERLRLSGIDAPEMGQLCERSGGGGYHCGEQARAALGRILGGGALSCEVLDTDRYQRRVVRCVNAEGQDIAAAMVAAGWAMAYRRYSMDYVPQENEARAHRRGIWAGRVEPPWDWRQRQGY